MAKTRKNSQATRRARKTVKGGHSPARSSPNKSHLTVARSVSKSVATRSAAPQLLYETDDYVRQKFSDIKTDWSNGQIKQYFVKDGQGQYHKIGVFHPKKFDAKKKIVDVVTDVNFVMYEMDPTLPKEMLGHGKAETKIDMTKNVVYSIEKQSSGGRRKSRHYRRHRWQRSRVTRRHL